MAETPNPADLNVQTEEVAIIQAPQRSVPGGGTQTMDGPIRSVPGNPPSSSAVTSAWAPTNKENLPMIRPGMMAAVAAMALLGMRDPLAMQDHRRTREEFPGGRRSRSGATSGRCWRRRPNGGARSGPSGPPRGNPHGVPALPGCLRGERDADRRGASRCGCRPGGPREPGRLPPGRHRGCHSR